MAGENNGSSPAPGISAPSPPPAGRLTGVFPVALPVMPPNFGNPTRGACIAPGPRHSPATSPGAVPTTHPRGTAAPGATRPLAEDSLPAHRGPNTPWVCPRCPRGEHRPAARPSRQRSPGDPRAVSCAGLAPPPLLPPFPGCGKLSKQADGAGGAAAARRRAEKAIFSRYIFYKSNILCSSASPVKPSRDRAPGRKSRRRRGTTPPGSQRQKGHEWGPNAPSPPFRVGNSLPRCWGSAGWILAQDYERCACPVPPAARGRGRRWARTRPRCSPAVPRTWKLNMLTKHGEQTEGLCTGLCVGTQGGARLGAALLCAHILLAAASGVPWGHQATASVPKGRPIW